MKRFTPTLLIALLPLAACAGDAPTAPDSPQYSAGGKGGGSGTVWAYTMEGDITGGGATITSKSAPTFSRVTLDNMTLTLDEPSGDIEQCRTGSGTYATDFHESNRGRTWTGTVTISNTKVASFLGTDGLETLQFSISDATGGPVLSAHADGTYSYAYTDARLFHGSNSTHYDGMYRCVNVTFVASAES